MKHLVSHLIREHLPQIAAQSLMNCHVRGLHSIMFLDTPEQRVRLFVTTEAHDLHQNWAGGLVSLAAHPHHCSLTLHCVHGMFENLAFHLEEGCRFKAFRYSSALVHGKGGFVREDQAMPARYTGSEWVGRGDSIHLPASLIHSVRVPKNMVAAWFVYEGKEDAGYSSLSYSDQDLEKADFSGLYGPMSEETVLELLAMVGLLEPEYAAPTH